MISSQTCTMTLGDVGSHSNLFRKTMKIAEVCQLYNLTSLDFGHYLCS